MTKDALTVFILIAAANSAPVLARNLMGPRAAWPVDGGLRFIDGRPLLGAAKTWRGIVSATACCAAGGWLAFDDAALGAKIALASMAGDLLSSFTKRRLHVESSGKTVGLDQIPESLLPALLAWKVGTITLAQAMVIAVAFTALELAVSPLLFRLGLRKKPY